jgi:hypothetical protein
MGYEFDWSDLVKYRPKYEEGMALTEELVRNATKCAFEFHDLITNHKQMHRVANFRELDDVLARFAKIVRVLWKNRVTDSLDILSWYFELDGCFRACQKVFNRRGIFI